ncbi:hypothetical protein [Rhizobium gallicum]|uniref:hypothetical protein n=1 Tax=Rhizobium gallicum TaxID=56730 RepID=UPI001EF76DE8|nr:hypothetical protein [Rhizobium gallicum]ULJ74408.1 hypothetical protein L2W42_21245 [Rhizobium gallicum]
MVDASKLTADEQSALKALQRYDPTIIDPTKINFFDVIENFGRGTMVLAEVTRKNDEGVDYTTEFRSWSETVVGTCTPIGTLPIWKTKPDHRCLPRHPHLMWSWQS